MELNMKERITMMNVLPEKGNFATMSVIERIKTKLYPSEEEIAEFEIKQNGSVIMWNKGGDTRKDIPLTDSQLKYAKERLDDISGKNELEYDQYLILKKVNEILGVVDEEK